MNPTESLKDSRNKLDSIFKGVAELNSKIRQTIEISNRLNVKTTRPKFVLDCVYHFHHGSLHSDKISSIFSRHQNINWLPIPEKVNVEPFFPFDYTNKIRNQIAHRDILQSNFITKEISLSAKIENLVGVLDRNNEELEIIESEGAGMSSSFRHLPFIIDSQKENELSFFEKIYYDLASIFQGFVELKEVSNVLETIKKNIVFLLGKIKKQIRNLRNFFTKHHSFHFKNLDDCHDSSFDPSFVG